MLISDADRMLSSQPALAEAFSRKCRKCPNLNA